MKLLGPLPPREIEGATEVLDGLLAETASGNVCAMWQARTETRIAFVFEWRSPATPADTAEVMALTDEIMGKPPSTYIEADRDLVQLTGNWLRTGQDPPKRRAH